MLNQSCREQGPPGAWGGRGVLLMGAFKHPFDTRDSSEPPGKEKGRDPPLHAAGGIAEGLAGVRRAVGCYRNWGELHTQG